MKKLEQLINKKDFCYINKELNENNFPIPTIVQTESWKLIKMDKTLSSEEALAKIKSEGCRPANAYELALWADKNKDKEIPKGRRSSVLAFGQLWEDADGGHRVPSVGRDSDGDFEFRLGGFVFDWYDDYCLLCFCDSTQALSTSETSPQSLCSLDEAIKICKANGLRVTREKVVIEEL